MKLPICLLVDNGSLRPEAIFSLRRVAQKLAIETEFEVLPVGLLHSNKIKVSDLDDIKAETIGTFLTSPRGKNEKSLLILPLFLGPSRGITEWLVSRLEEWRREEADRSYQVLDCLHVDGDYRLAMALAGGINNLIDREDLSNPRVAMVDHGTPIAEVNRVREQKRSTSGNEDDDESFFNAVQKHEYDSKHPKKLLNRKLATEEEKTDRTTHPRGTRIVLPLMQSVDVSKLSSNMTEDLEPRLLLFLRNLSRLILNHSRKFKVFAILENFRFF